MAPTSGYLYLHTWEVVVMWLQSTSLDFFNPESSFRRWEWISHNLEETPLVTESGCVLMLIFFLWKSIVLFKAIGYQKNKTKQKLTKKMELEISDLIVVIKLQKGVSLVHGGHRQVQLQLKFTVYIKRITTA